MPNFALRHALAELPPALLQQAPATTRLSPVPEAEAGAASSSSSHREEGEEEKAGHEEESKDGDGNEKEEEGGEPAVLRRALDAAEARMAPWHRYQMNPALGGQWGC